MMSLTSFRASVQCAACHRCGNALRKGVHECPHCGALQTAIALRAPNSFDSSNGVPLQRQQRMLVPYPSVPEEVDVALNLSHQRAQAIRRGLFAAVSCTALSAALVLTVGPSLRAPASAQIAALPERDAAVPEEGPTVTADAALPSHAPGTPGPTGNATTVLQNVPATDPVTASVAPMAAAPVTASAPAPAPVVMAQQAQAAPKQALQAAPGTAPVAAHVTAPTPAPVIMTQQTQPVPKQSLQAAPNAAPVAAMAAHATAPAPTAAPVVMAQQAQPAAKQETAKQEVKKQDTASPAKPDDPLYAARLALIANDLSATRTSLLQAAPSRPGDPEVQRIADELTRREAVRDANLLRAHSCDAANLLPCARRYAKAALAIDTSYADSQTLLKQVAYKTMLAKKAAAAQMQAVVPPPRPAPIREAAPLVHYVSNAASAPLANTVPTPIAPRTYAVAAVHPVQETRDVREPVAVVQEVRPVEQPAPSGDSSDTGGYSIPIMARGRGVAH